MTQSKTYKGLDLLDKIFEFTAMTPEVNQWNVSSLEGNPPRQIRLKQINSLMKVFLGQKSHKNLFEKTKALISGATNTTTVQSVLSGDFIKNRQIEDYAELVSLMTQIVTERQGGISKDQCMHVMKLIMPYQNLVRYKRKLVELLTFNSGWLEASSITSWFSIYLTDSVTSNLQGKYTVLDWALELFINPQGLVFTEEELITKFNFPTENLRDIDMDYT